MLAADDTGDGAVEDVRFLDAFRIPLVRAVMPAAAAVALGLGALFSLGIVFVNDVLRASDTEFGVLIALFGVGAALGLGVLQLRRGHDPLTETRLGVAAIGAIVALFSLATSVWLAFAGAAAFGAAAAYSLSSGMGALQSRLEGQQRVLAFAAFHVVIRIGLSLAAIGAGLAGDLLGDVKWPWVGELEPSRVVLLCSGLLVVLSSALVRLRESPQDEPERA
jgi:predicted MFS family arabinose efflux permease